MRTGIGLWHSSHTCPATSLSVRFVSSVEQLIFLQEFFWFWKRLSAFGNCQLRLTKLRIGHNSFLIYRVNYHWACLSTTLSLMENFLYRPQSTCLIGIWWHFSCVASAYWMSIRWRWHWYGSKRMHTNWTSSEGVTRRWRMYGWMYGYCCLYLQFEETSFSMYQSGSKFMFWFDQSNTRIQMQRAKSLFKRPLKFMARLPITHSFLPINLYVVQYPLQNSSLFAWRNSGAETASWAPGSSLQTSTCSKHSISCCFPGKQTRATLAVPFCQNLPQGPIPNVEYFGRRI